MNKWRTTNMLFSNLLILMLGLLTGGLPTIVCSDESVRGPAFSDPHQIVTMPQEWMQRPIEYDAQAKQMQADLAITLDQHTFLMLEEKIIAFGKKKGIKIVNQEGTCGISDGFLLRKQADLATFCCAPSAAERLPNLKYYTLGIAAKVFIVHPDNPVNNLTVDQLRTIYQGQVSRWSDIAGLAGAPNLPINVIGRLHCKLRPGHWRLLLDNENLFSPRMKEVSAIPDVISSVMADPGAIGYETLTNIERFKKGQGPKILFLEGEDPHDLAAIATLRYPLYRTFVLAAWEGKLRNPHVDGLLSAMQQAAESLEYKHGFVPVSRLRQTGWQFLDDEVIGEPLGRESAK